jgi:hypothetical protein
MGETGSTLVVTAHGSITPSIGATRLIRTGILRTNMVEPQGETPLKIAQEMPVKMPEMRTELLRAQWIAGRERTGVVPARRWIVLRIAVDLLQRERWIGQETGHQEERAAEIVSATATCLAPRRGVVAGHSAVAAAAQPGPAAREDLPALAEAVAGVAGAVVVVPVVDGADEDQNGR